MGAKPSRNTQDDHSHGPPFGTLVGGFSSSCLSFSCLCFCAFLIVAVIFGIAQTQVISEAGKTVTTIGTTPEGAAALGTGLTSLLGKPGTTVTKTATTIAKA